MKYSLLFLAFASFAFGKTAPLFQGEFSNGDRASLAKILKDSETEKKSVLLAFWATWCQPCMSELKTITEKMKEDPNLPIKLITVNVDTSETAIDVKPTLKLYKFNFPVVLDPKHEIFSKYQEAKNLPYSVLIKPNGEIATSFTGYDEEMFTKVRKALE